jgi:hypothetical protein
MLQGTAEVKLGERATERERERILQSFVVRERARGGPEAPSSSANDVHCVFSLVTSGLTLSALRLAILQHDSRTAAHSGLSRSKRITQQSDLLHQAKLRLRLISSQVQSDVLV